MGHYFYHDLLDGMYPENIRLLTLKVYKQIKSLRKTSELVDISKSTIQRWNLSNERKHYPSRPSKLQNPVVIDVLNAFLKTHIIHDVGMVREEINKRCGIIPSNELIRLFIKKNYNLRYKKPRFYPMPCEKTLLDKTDEFIQQMKRTYTNNKEHTFVSIDEVGFSSNTRPLKGWFEKGKEYHIRWKPSSKDKKRKSCCCSISSEGTFSFQKIEGHYTTSSFLSFLHSQNYPYGSVILMDNVRFHHSKDVKNLMHAKGWNAIYVPPYSPWFNPIEKAFSVVKNDFRKNQSIESAFQKIQKSSIIRYFESLKNLIISKK